MRVHTGLYEPQFGLTRCPHCEIANPHFTFIDQRQIGRSLEFFAVMECRTCYHLTMVKGRQPGAVPIEIWPAAKTYSNDIPERARRSLADARAAMATPSLSIIGSARAVDFMLSERGYPGGDRISLAGRIRKAAEDHVITEDMREWADDIRLDANAERHPDPNAPDPTVDDAQRVLGFAEALAEILFELPARVRRGRQAGSANPEEPVSFASGGGAGRHP